VHVVPDRGRTQRVLADRPQHGADRRSHDAQGDDDACEVAEGEETVERPAGRESQVRETEVEASASARPAARSRRRSIPTAD
jgi:hypothetical protein